MSAQTLRVIMNNPRGRDLGEFIAQNSGNMQGLLGIRPRVTLRVKRLRKLLELVVLTKKPHFIA